jgi:ABC-2 type transport system permease protein
MMTYLRTIAALTKLLVRRYFRSKTALFFSIFFPLIFLFVFGSLYGKSNDTSFKVAVISHSQSDFAKQFNNQLGQLKILKVQKDITNLEAAKLKMKRGEVDSIIELPDNFGQPGGTQNLPQGEVKVYYDQSSAQAGQTVASILDSVLQGVNAQLTKIEPPLTVTTVSTAQKGLTGFDYIFAGMLGFSLIGLGIFGPVNMLPAEKKTGALTRLKVTPLKSAQFIIAYMFSTLATGILSIAVMFACAVIFFNFHMVGNYLIFALFTLYGAICIFGIGVAVGGWAKDERQAAPLSNIVAFPLLFLSGTFFPRFLMPEWLQRITYYLPLTPIVDGIRMILTEGKRFLDLGPQLGIITVWIIVVYTIAFNVFRWE